METIFSFSHKRLCLLHVKSKKKVYQNVSALTTICNNTQFITCNKPELLKLFKEKQLLHSKNIVDILDIFLLLYPKSVCAPSIYSVYKYVTKKDIVKPLEHDEKLFQEVKLIQELLQEFKQQIKKFTVKEKENFVSLLEFLKVDEPLIAEFFYKNLGTENSKVQQTKMAIEVWNKITEYKKSADDDSIKINNLAPVESITSQDVIKELEAIIQHKGIIKTEQKHYSQHVAKMFMKTEKNVAILAEAGTGTGKTLGYIAPVLAFLQQNPKQQVLISTYSKALQKQVFKELQNSLAISNLRTKACIIKGNNNYICLLNYEYLVNNTVLFPRARLFLAVLSLWLQDSEYGDFIGGDVSPLVFHLFTTELGNFVLNRHEECLYNRCKHFKKCFIMNTKKKAKDANIIVTNHYYTLLNAGLGVKYAIFDEAHHLLNAADEVFSFSISNKSIAQLNYWLLGSSNQKKIIRAELNGFKQRLSFLLQDGESSLEIKDINDMLLAVGDTLLESCAPLIADMLSLNRVTGHMPNNLIEEFLHYIYLYVLEKSDDLQQYYSLESAIEYQELPAGLLANIEKLIAAFERTLNIAANFYGLLQQKVSLVKQEEKTALEDFIKLFESKFLTGLAENVNMLGELTNKTPDKDFIYRFVIEKDEGRITNIAYYKNYVNPAQPLANATFANLNAFTLTSATLLDTMPTTATNETFLKRYGLEFLPYFHPEKVQIKSSFNYKQNSKIFIINNANPNNLAVCIESLFKASGGGGLALFTALSRLKQVYKGIYSGLLEADINLLSASMNNQKIENLIDIFKDDENSCLLGSDSARDGIDIPGKALRLVVFERTPWPKSDLLYKSRVKHLGKEYTLELIRLKLRQALGRIIRTYDDKGIFVILDKSFPSSLIHAFPEDVTIHKVSLTEALPLVESFFNYN
ncbi:ATP-dependent RNA helicase SrmB [Candidatus Hepatincola sp. Av]